MYMYICTHMHIYIYIYVYRSYKSSKIAKSFWKVRHQKGTCRLWTLGKVVAVLLLLEHSTQRLIWMLQPTKFPKSQTSLCWNDNVVSSINLWWPPCSTTYFQHCQLEPPLGSAAMAGNGYDLNLTCSSSHGFAEKTTWTNIGQPPNLILMVYPWLSSFCNSFGKFGSFGFLIFLNKAKGLHWQLRFLSPSLGKVTLASRQAWPWLPWAFSWEIPGVISHFNDYVPEFCGQTAAMSDTAVSWQTNPRPRCEKLWVSRLPFLKRWRTWIKWTLFETRYPISHPKGTLRILVAQHKLHIWSKPLPRESHRESLCASSWYHSGL